MAKSEGHVFRVNEVVPVCAAPTPSLPPTPAGLGVFLFKSQAAYFKHWLKSIIYRQIFRRVQSSLGAEGVSICSSPHCCALGSDSKGRVKNLKVVKVLYPVFSVISSSFNAFITTSLQSPWSCPGGGSGRASLTAHTRGAHRSPRARSRAAGQHSTANSCSLGCFKRYLLSGMPHVPESMAPYLITWKCVGKLASQEEKSSSGCVIAKNWISRQF